MESFQFGVLFSLNYVFDDVFKNLTFIYAIITIFSKKIVKHIDIENYDFLFPKKKHSFFQVLLITAIVFFRLLLEEQKQLMTNDKRLVPMLYLQKILL